MARKKTSPWKMPLLSLLLTVALYGGGVLLITLLVIGGYIPEGRIAPALTALALLVSLVGGVATGRGSAGARGSLVNTALFSGVLLLLCFACWQGITPQGLILLTAILLGGAVAGLFRRKVGKRPGKRLVKSYKKA